MSDTGFQTTLAVVAICIAGAIGAYAITRSTDDPAPLRAIDASGYTAARITDTHSITAELNGCAEEEIAYDAEATNVNGKRVKLVVCCGLFVKACTVRVP